MQLWGVEAAALLDSMPCEGDLITVVEPLADEPYILLGCDSGNVQVAGSHLLFPTGPVRLFPNSSAQAQNAARHIQCDGRLNI